MEDVVKSWRKQVSDGRDHKGEVGPFRSTVDYGKKSALLLNYFSR